MRHINISLRIFYQVQWHPTAVLLPGKSHGQRSLVGCSPWDLEESDMTLLHFSFSCIGEGNGNPLQCSCLENPRHGGAWWAAVCGVAQSWTRLKPLSSSMKNKNRSILKDVINNLNIIDLFILIYINLIYYTNILKIYLKISHKLLDVHRAFRKTDKR